MNSETPSYYRQRFFRKLLMGQGCAPRQLITDKLRSYAAAHRAVMPSVHSIVRNLFNVGRHLLRAAHHRVLRTRSFAVWHDVTCGC